MSQRGIKAFFKYAHEREMIRLTRESGLHAPPFTKDPVLRQYRFCNIFREDDRVTQWFRDAVRQPLRDDPRVILATVIFRWFNRIETGKALCKHGLLDDWDAGRANKVLGNLSPLVTGAYMIKTPGRMTKLEGLIWCINIVWRQRERLQEELSEVETLEQAHAHLMEFPYLGAFMSYEVVTDLRHTAVLEDATDIFAWASAGPGAARGLGRILSGNPDQFSYTGRADQESMLKEMRHLLSLSRDGRYWPPHWPAWEMREVEHTLCEFDKYERARLGEGTPKQRFTPCT